MGLTQAARQREMFEDAKDKGRDIMQVRGKRGPTEVHRDGAWTKVKG